MHYTYTPIGIKGDSEMIKFIKDDEKRTLLFMGISSAALLLDFFGIGTVKFYSEPFASWPGEMGLSWTAVLLCGIPIIAGAFQGLIREFDITADVLVSIALIASAAVSEVFAAGEVALIMTAGAWLEERTVKKARAGIQRLVDMTPVSARVVSSSGEETVIPAVQVREGDILRVFAGETISADGVIVKGQTSVDQSVMTGESLPADKSAGDEVQSGTVNQFGTFDMCVMKAGEDSSLQRMIRLAQSADAGKAKIVRLADRWAVWTVAAALVCAVLSWVLSGQVIRAVTVLVVFCPCALVLSTPAAIMAGIGNAAKYGMLVSQGDALERLASVKRIAFDKTGTLTYGKPSVVKAGSFCSDLSTDQLFEISAAAEARSEHPLGKAVVSYFVQEYGRMPEQPDEFELLAGRGVIAGVGGRTVTAGNRQFTEERGFYVPEGSENEIKAAEAEGCTVIYIADEKEMLGFIALSDTLRPDAKDTVSAVHQTGTGTVLLTGDTPQAAMHIAGLAGIEDVHAACLPEDKLMHIRRYQQQGEPVCMVGDGINDAPALRAAHAGIAMGGIGSDIAVDAADIALVSDDIKEIPHLLNLSKKMMKTIRINLAVSMILNFAAAGLAASGMLGPVMGALVHNAGSAAVIINSSMLLKWRKKQPRHPL